MIASFLSCSEIYAHHLQRLQQPENNFLFFSLEMVSSLKIPQKMLLQRQEFIDFLLCQMLVSVPIY